MSLTPLPAGESVAYDGCRGSEWRAGPSCCRARGKGQYRPFAIFLINVPLRLWHEGATRCQNLPLRGLYCMGMEKM